MQGILHTLILGLVMLLITPFSQASVNTGPRIDCRKEIVACAVYMEARGESVKGQYSVAFLIHNRSMDYRFPTNVKDVVLQRGQFPWTKQRRIVIRDHAAFERARAIAREVATLRYTDIAAYHKADPTRGAVFFNAKHLHPKHFRKHATNITVVDSHIFFGKRRHT